MGPQDAYQTLLERLRSAAGLLERSANHRLQQDVHAICQQTGRANFRIAVFGPFNYGKSTLLNALLGERALPIDLIPTTGAAITVQYGELLRSQIRLTDGRTIEETGTEILKQFAILNDERRMRDDVAAVSVFCPHPFLQLGVELVDLPGTNDREAQDALVKDQLLTADLIVQVLDGRKLMTLGEREHLRDWLLDRGIETVIFVVNFLNLLEPEEQKQVYNRLRFVAESFRSQLPPGVSNLYRVDALPALRARLKGNMADAQAAGLPMLESALHTIVEQQKEQTATRIPRAKVLSHQVQQALQAQAEQLQTELMAVTTKRDQRVQIKQQAAQLIHRGFTASVTKFTEWLSLINLLDHYQNDAAEALFLGQFKAWEMGGFKATAIDHQQAVAKWIQQACEFFERDRPNQLLVSFPPPPQIELPHIPTTNTGGKSSSLNPETLLAGGLGLVLGGPVVGAILGGASYLLNKTLDSDSSAGSTSLSEAQVRYACLEAARDYLVNFSALNLAALQRYEIVAERVIHYEVTAEGHEMTEQHYQLQLLQTTLANLEEALRSL
ncbi:dynamin family protein [Pantanalinema sp. GBBB05]|uniref:dynamin family protein n=1 Tax=Pantanalinema sp. GBBB05 TaxID=2604139 RepID=UPI001E1930D6|nr:dynamin [Pantanalinema sp. GBBB05]